MTEVPVMQIKRLKLKNFRNIKALDLELAENVNIFYGDNAQGKTNILESMFLCATGRSQRTRVDKDMIYFGENEAHISVFSESLGFNNKIDIHLNGSEKKRIFINSVPAARLGELFGTVNVVYFSPEDLMLIKEGPSYRRRYMDIELCQISRIYYSDLQRYYRALKERNNLLKKLAVNKKNADMLDIWDEQLCGYAARLMNSRREYIDGINERAKPILNDLTGKKEMLKIVYKSNVDENIKKRLKEARDKDILYGNTSVGIHKDDILFYINGVNAREFASQGQQRSIIICLKLSEVELLSEKLGKMPVLLLDDVLSELDRSRQSYILNNIQKLQTMITCTGLEDIGDISNTGNIYKVKKGEVSK